MSSTELSTNVVYEVRQSMANPNNIDVIVKSFSISDGLAQLISGTNENANDDLKLRVFCKALREVIDMVNSWKFLDAHPNDDGFTIQRKTPENATDVMMLAYNSSKIHVWLQQFTKFAIDIIILLAPTKAITPIDINIDTSVRFDRSVQQEISLCALLDRITSLTSNGLRYRRRGRIIMVVGSIACLIAGFVYGLPLQAAMALPFIGGFAYLFYYRPYRDIIKQADNTFGQYKHRLKKLCQQHPDWNVADAR